MVNVINKRAGHVSELDTNVFHTKSPFLELQYSPLLNMEACKYDILRDRSTAYVFHFLGFFFLNFIRYIRIYNI